MAGGFRDLGSFLEALEAAGEVRRVRVEVDPVLEITEIVSRVTRAQGPALVFERVKGSPFPLAVNLLGSPRRIEIALGAEPEAVGKSLVSLAHAAQSFRIGEILKSWRLGARALSMKPRRAALAPSQAVSEKPDLGRLPIIQCWPGDGGRFLTFGMVETADPDTGVRNLGIYRMQVFDSERTGMHWQIQKGGGFHYHVAESRGLSLPVAVVVGADPALMLSSVAPLPEGLDEFAFAGFLRGRPTEMVPGKRVPLLVPARAEFILEGEVRPGEREPEGPFGDHFGHYSHAAPYPVLRLLSVTHNRSPVFTASIVGKPPQEDKFMGEAVGAIFSPLLGLMHPEVRDVWAYFEAGFHNLLVVSVRERYAKEGMKAALGLLGQGQLSLTKCLILVDEEVNPRDWDAVLAAIREEFDPSEDFLLIPGVPLDTLDFTSYKMNLGSKMVLDATSRRIDPALRSALPITRARHEGLVIPVDIERIRGLDPRVLECAVIQSSILFVKVDSKIARGGNGAGGPILAKILESGAADSMRIIAVVSEDVSLAERTSRLWGLFTRFDAARDVRFRESTLANAWPTHRGPLGIDATWKTGYPDPVAMTDEIVRLVDEKWDSYRITK